MKGWSSRQSETARDSEKQTKKERTRNERARQKQDVSNKGFSRHGADKHLILLLIPMRTDLGFGDVTVSLGVNRTHTIPTPNVQRMADNGLRFLRGYTGQVCAPSRYDPRSSRGS